MAKAKEALKKSDLLSALKDKKGENRTDLTKEGLREELAKKFAFIPEFFDYLFATYAAGGRFAVGDDGALTIKEVGQVRTEPRTIYSCSVELNVELDEQDDEGNDLVEDQVSLEEDTLMPGDKLPEGWSLSKNSAAKMGKKAAYADYKASCVALDEWAATPDEEEEVAEAA